MSEQYCDVGRGITLCYETFGDPSNPAALLIMGLGTQMIAWHEDFCAQLADRGLHVVRFDNRDIGRSTHVAGRPPTIPQLLLRSTRAARYSLADMAQDSLTLMRELELSPAHMIGASMGGMIAQILAGTEPQRVASLGIIMSTTGKPFSRLPAWRVIRLAFGGPGDDASDEDKLAFEVRNVAVFNGPNFLPPEAQLRERVRQLAERSSYPPGMLRQFDAVLGTGSLLAYSKAITAPTVVLHGSRDPMVRPRNGRGVAAAIPGARFVVVDGMGHDLPQPVWRPIIETLTENFARARAR